MQALLILLVLAYMLVLVQNDQGMVVILGVVCSALLAVTALGIIGLTSYLVAQRRRQLGMVRTLGAPRSSIFHYFQTENLSITGAGATIGVVMALFANLWMVSTFAQQRLNIGYMVIGAIAVLLLGHVTLLRPVRKAASISPGRA